jgi:hypothetical protein
MESQLESAANGSKFSYGREYGAPGRPRNNWPASTEGSLGGIFFAKLAAFSDLLA